MKTDKDKGRKSEKGTDNVKKKREKCVSPKKKRMKVNRRNADEDFLDGPDKPVNSNDCDDETDKTMPGSSSSIDDNSATSNEQHQHPNKRKIEAAVPLSRKKWKRFDSKDENEDWIPDSEDDENDLNVTSPDATQGSEKNKECDPRLVKIANNVWRRLEVPGDGNCDFSSIAVVSGQGVGQSGKMRQDIVKAATEELWDEDIKQQILTEHFPGPEYQGKTDDEIKQLYKTKMGTLGTFGSDLEILVAGRILPTAFSYVQLYSNLEPNQKPYRVCNVDPNSEKPRKWIFYSGDYVHGLGHWEPLEAIGHIEPLENGMYIDADASGRTQETVKCGKSGCDKANVSYPVYTEHIIKDHGKTDVVPDEEKRKRSQCHNPNFTSNSAIKAQQQKEFATSNDKQKGNSIKHVCQLCPNNRSFTTKYTLKYHIRTIHGKDPDTNKDIPKKIHVCHLCPNNRSFTTKYNLAYHEKTVHGKDSDLPKRSFVCNLCIPPKHFNSDNSLNGHERNIHQAWRRNDRPKETYICNLCVPPKKFPSKYPLQRHSRDYHFINFDTKKALPEDNRVCRFCPGGKTYATKASLNQHIRDVHGKHPGTYKDLPKENHICKICLPLKKFKSRTILRKHMLAIHLKDPKTGINLPKADTVCNFCIPSRGFKSIAGLNNHMKLIHRKDRHGKDLPKQNYFCHICNPAKEFSTKMYRNNHLFQYHHVCAATGIEIPKGQYSCISCQRIFPYKQQLQKHVRYHHTVASSSGYSCPKCKKEFISERGMNIHINGKFCVPSNLKRHCRRFACTAIGCHRIFTSFQACQVHSGYHKKTRYMNPNLASLPPLLGLNRLNFCGTRRCGKGCASCDHIIHRRRLTLGNETFTATNPYSCKSARVIYCISCGVDGCKQFYVGMTVHSLATRFACHISCCRNGKKTKLYKHFHKHGIDNMRVDVLYQQKKCINWQDKLRAMEGQYIKETEAVKSLNSINGLLNGKALLIN